MLDQFFNKLSQNHRRLLSFFFILEIYVIIFVGWWCYMHIRNIGIINELEIENTRLVYEVEGNDENPENAPKSKKDEFELKTQWFQVASEGAFFFLVLIFGGFYVQRGLTREIAISQQQRNFLLSITHELKSPIASIKLALETMKRPGITEQMNQRLIGNSLRDTERLKNLVENILMAAKIENAEENLVSEMGTNLSRILRDLEDRADLSKEVRETEFRIQPGVIVVGDEGAITSLAVNLVENAFKYSKPGDSIKVGLVTKNKQAIFSVEDQGIGISDKDKINVFDKFYRVGNEDTRRTKGTGLGLFLVKQIVHINGGEITITDNLPKGTVFTVELNLHEDHFKSQIGIPAESMI